ncbi:MAG: hypothetical protein H7Z16_20555 [Pyrinomonadaceae bacterium]|nr:hypothetical protein [Pyrinomonadaceae bacterium]
MQSRFRRYRSFQRHLAFLLAVVFVVGLCLTDADAQRRRRRVRSAPRPVITNPDIAPPGSESIGPDGERIISTADEDPESEPASETAGAKQRKATPTEAQRMQQKINALSNQIDRLERLGQANETERAQLEMERLTRAEQRGESLRTQLVDVESKLADLQPRLDELDYASKPENIERSAAGFGTVRPEDVRETRRRQLEVAKAGLQRQIKILEASRVRLEAAIVTADAEVDRLRRRLEAREMQEQATPTVGETRRPDAPTPPQ